MFDILKIVFEIVKIISTLNWNGKKEQASAALLLLKAKDVDEKKEIVKQLGDKWSGLGRGEHENEEIISSFSRYGGGH